jgi:hypothetical protein
MRRSAKILVPLLAVLFFPMLPQNLGVAPLSPMLPQNVEGANAQPAVTDPRGVYVARADFSVPANTGVINWEATCNSGDFATGGGWRGQFGLNVIESAPTLDGLLTIQSQTPNGWGVNTLNPTSTALAITILADCMSPPASGYVARADFSVPANSGTMQWTTACNSGDFATGGGWTQEIGLNTVDGLPTLDGLLTSQGQTPNGWTVTTLNPKSTALEITALADCMPPTPAGGYVARSDLSVPANSGTYEWTATCNSGDFATGGGWSQDVGLNTLGSFSTINGATASQGQTPNGWTATILNPTSTALGISVLADCMSPKPADRRVTQTANSIVLSQTEPSIAVNPRQPNNIIVGYNDDSQLNTVGFPRPHYSVSTNGGQAWTAGTNALVAPTGDIHSLCCDPGVAFDSAGNAYYATMDDDFNAQPGYNIIIYTSAPGADGNAGAIWSNPVIVSSNGDRVDKPAIAVDRTGGAHDGNIYVAWVNYTYDTQGFLTNMTILFRVGRLVGGVPTFTTNQVVASANTGFFWGPALAVAPDGTLYVSYFHMTPPCVQTYYGCEYIAGFSYTDAIMVSRSDDGGSTFALVNGKVASVAGPAVTDGAAIRTSALPTITVTADGTVVAAWTDSGVGTGAGAGRLDVRSARSTDRGATWSTPITVNNDPADTKTDHFLPVATAAGSTIYIFFYDRRNDPADTDAYLYAAKSTDDGQTFPVNFAVSDTASDPSVCSSQAPPAPCLWGDYLSATELTEGPLLEPHFYVVWADSRDSVSAGDEDVNIYFNTFGVGGIAITQTWNWRLTLLNQLFPLSACRTFSSLCSASIAAKILATGGFNQTVNLYAGTLPPGVSVSFSTIAGTPPFSSLINVDARNATCSSNACVDDIVLYANSTDGPKPITLQLTLNNKPFIQLDSSMYAPGSNMTLTAEGLTPNTQVQLLLGGVTLSTYTTDGTGSLKLSQVIPEQATNGVHTLYITDTSGTTLATTSFVTTNAQVDVEFVPQIPPSGSVGGTTLPVDKLGLVIHFVTIVASVLAVMAATIQVTRLASRNRSKRRGTLPQAKVTAC